MNIPQIIQGGMGVAISDWRLAKAVSQEGQLGVVSGTGVAIILIARLMNGDPEGHVRRALSHFPTPEHIQWILDDYFIPGGKDPAMPYKRATMWSLKPPLKLNQLTVVANFVEVFLAREGHSGLVGINLLEKVQLPNTASLYGAMLAGVDVVIMGAGIPFQIPGILDDHSEHRPTSYRIDVIGAAAEDEYRVHFDPEAVFPGISAKAGKLKRPHFLPIISSVVLAQALLKRSTGAINGFVIENFTAGGHNAPPRGTVQYNEHNEPIYTDKDVVDLEKMQKLGLPFWLAGSYGNPQKFQEALASGAAGVQVGTAFAYCQDSGMDPTLKMGVLSRALEDEIVVRTSSLASPTGFPFKVVQLPNTLADMALYEARERVCDLGYLRSLYKDEMGKVGYRCASEPVEDYVRKGGMEEDAAGRTCLCNNLGAAAGFPNRRKNGYVEPALITSGDDLVNIGQYIRDGKLEYYARDVINYLLGVTEPA
jgi:nitronate monooxygenase